MATLVELDDDSFWEHVYDMDHKGGGDRPRGALLAKQAVAAGKGKRPADSHSDGRNSKRPRVATEEEYRRLQHKVDVLRTKLREAESKLCDLGGTIHRDALSLRLSFLSHQIEDREARKGKAKNAGENLLCGSLKHPYGFKVADEDVIEQVRALRTRIADLIRDHCPGLSAANIIRMMQGLCWKELRRVIFDASSTYWANDFGASMSEWFERTRDPAVRHWPRLLPELHEQRARMATFLDRLHGDPNVERDARAVVKIFGHHITGGKSLVARSNWGRFLQDGLEIVHLAADLDIVLRRSLSDFRLRIVNGDDDQAPRLLVVERYGNAGGDDYSTVVELVSVELGDAAA
ncbi:hypothetical protein VTK56DRAFT_6430 [Thermocarpiscus australiensis]